MKPFITILLCLFSFSVLSGNITIPPSDTLFHDDFSSISSWFSQGSGRVNVNNGKCNFDSVYCGEYNRVYSDLGRILPMNYWKAECSFSILEQNPEGYGTGEVVIALTAGSLDFMSYDIQQYYEETYQDGIAVVLMSDGSIDNDINNWYFMIEGKKGNYRTFDLSTVIHANSGISTYYLSLERTSANSTQLSIFSDSARTLHLQGSPVSFIINSEIEGLNTIQHGAITPGYYSRRITACVDDDFVFGHFQSTGFATDFAAGGRLNVYPNPAKDWINIQQDDAPGIGGIVEYSIFNLFGTKITTGSLPLSLPLDISKLANGAFILVINSAEKQLRAKFIKRY